MWASAGRNPATSQTPYLESEMNHISNEDLLKLDTWIANNVPDKNFERLFTIWVHLIAEYSRLIQQRDAALKLADDWDGRVIAGYVCADELRAIFEPKEGK